jgi:hypothetical protein
MLTFLNSTLLLASLGRASRFLLRHLCIAYKWRFQFSSPKYMEVWSLLFSLLLFMFTDFSPYCVSNLWWLCALPLYFQHEKHMSAGSFPG